MLTLVLADLVDRHDPRMIEVGRRLGLGVEALDVGLVGELAGQDHLEGDGAVEADLPGLEDDAHAAAGDLADDLVVAEVADADGGDDPRRLVVGEGPESTVASSRDATVASSWTDGLAMSGIGEVGKLAGATVAAASCLCVARSRGPRARRRIRWPSSAISPR